MVSRVKPLARVRALILEADPEMTEQCQHPQVRYLPLRATLCQFMTAGLAPSANPAQQFCHVSAQRAAGVTK